MENQQNIASQENEHSETPYSDVVMKEVPEEEKVEFDGRIIDGIYQVVKAFDSEKDKKGLFVGLCKNMLDGRLYVIKAMGGSKAEMLHFEAANNEYLDGGSRYTVKMITFKPASPGMGILTLGNGEMYTTYSYMVIPYCKNGSLLRLLINSVEDKKPLSVLTQKKLCRQIVQCVAHMHQELGTAHLDLKADNFVITESFDLALIDFGMAEDCSELLEDTQKMTEIYRAPEVFEDDSYDPEAVDIFGIGVCMFMIMLRNAPFLREGCLRN